MNRAVFGCAGIFISPVLGTAISKTEAVADAASFWSNIGFVFSVFLIPIIFFGLYKLDRVVEKRVPKRGREKNIADGKTEFLKRV